MKSLVAAGRAFVDPTIALMVTGYADGDRPRSTRPWRRRLHASQIDQSINEAIVGVPSMVGAATAALAEAQAGYDPAKDPHKRRLADYEPALADKDRFLAAGKQITALNIRGFTLDIAFVRASGGGRHAAVPNSWRKL